MKRAFQERAVVAAGVAVIAATYGLVRLAYGLVLPAVQADLGVTVAAAGTVSGLASASYCVAAGLALPTCTRWPRQVVLAAGAVAAAGALGVALAQGVGAFAASFVVASAGAGAASPALVVLVRRVVPAEREARAQSLVNSGPGPGLVVAALLALAVAEQWRAAWVVAGVATAAATAWLLVALRGTAASGGAPEDEAIDASTAWIPPAVGALLLGIGSAAVWTFGRTVLQQNGLSAASSTGAWLFLGVGAVLSAPLTPVLLRSGTRSAWAGCLLTTAAATALFTTASVWWAAWLAATLFGLGFTAATTVLIAWASRVSTTPGAATSSFFIAAMLGQSLGAPLVGQLVGAVGATGAFGAAAAATAAGTLVTVVRPGRAVAAPSCSTPSATART